MNKYADNYADFSSESIVAFYPNQLPEMRKKAKKNSKQRYRICAHTSVDDELQEMYISAKNEGYTPPHRHDDTAETHYIISGTMATVIFNCIGKIKKIVILNKDYGALSCRVGKGIYHMDFFGTPWVDYLEFKKGPFTKFSNIIAPWAPICQGEKGEEAAPFMRNVAVAVSAEADRIGLAWHELCIGKADFNQVHED